MADFLHNNKYWLWRIPVNVYSLIIWNLPVWILVILIGVLTGDLILLGWKLREDKG